MQEPRATQSRATLHARTLCDHQARDAFRLVTTLMRHDEEACQHEKHMDPMGERITAHNACNYRSSSDRMPTCHFA